MVTTGTPVIFLISPVIASVTKEGQQNAGEVSDLFLNPFIEPVNDIKQKLIVFPGKI